MLDLVALLAKNMLLSVKKDTIEFDIDVSGRENCPNRLFLSPDVKIDS